MEILDQQAEKGKGMRMLLLNSKLAFLFFPDPSEEAHPEIRREAEAGSQAGLQVRSSCCLCWTSPEISLLRLHAKSHPPWSSQKGSGTFLTSEHCLLQLTTLPKLAES